MVRRTRQKGFPSYVVKVAVKGGEPSYPGNRVRELSVLQQ